MNALEDQFDYDGDGDAEDVLRWALGKFHPYISVACSFERPTVAHMALSIRSDARIFAIDTGRLPEETLECASEMERKYKAKVEWYHPKHEAIENLYKSKGLYSFKESVSNREECCGIRKVEPLSRALKGLKAWVTGVRRDQNSSRDTVDLIEIDEIHNGIIKINPLAYWSDIDVKGYMEKHQVPYNRLLDQGYTSIGCSPCTRAAPTCGGLRSGRWWWENEDHKECGIHNRNWNI